MYYYYTKLHSNFKYHHLILLCRFLHYYYHYHRINCHDNKIPAALGSLQKEQGCICFSIVFYVSMPYIPFRL